MKPKPFLRLFVILAIACLSLVMYASHRKLAVVIQRTEAEAPPANITQVSANDFIFFESLTKFLSIAISK